MTSKKTKILINSMLLIEDSYGKYGTRMVSKEDRFSWVVEKLKERKFKIYIFDNKEHISEVYVIDLKHKSTKNIEWIDLECINQKFMSEHSIFAEDIVKLEKDYHEENVYNILDNIVHIVFDEY